MPIKHPPRNAATYDLRHDFHASGSPETTKGSIRAGSAMLTLTEEIDFLPLHGILVAGAGEGGADLITVVVNVAGKRITLAEVAHCSVTAAEVMHDDTAALQAALDVPDIESSTTFFVRGTYRCNRPFRRDTNSVLAYPMNASGNPPYTVRWVGEVAALTSGSAPPQTGVIVDMSRISSRGTGTYPSFIAAMPWSFTSGADQFNFVAPQFLNFYFRTAPDPKITVLNFNNAVNAQLDNVQFDTGVPFADIAEPTDRQSAAIAMPGVNNYAQTMLRSVSILGGFWAGIRFAEHTRFIHCFVAKCRQALFAEGGYHLNEGNVGIEQCGTLLYVQRYEPAPIESTFRLSLNVEKNDAARGQWYGPQPNGDIVVEEPGFARGIIEYKLTISNVGDTEQSLQTTNAESLNLINLYTGHSTRWG